MTAATDTKPAAEPAPLAPGAQLDEEQRRRRRKAIVLLVLLAGLLILLLLFAWYLIFRQPINPIPAIPVSQVPKYQASIYGAQRPTGITVSPSGDRIYVTQGAAAIDGIIFDGGGKVIAKMTPPSSLGADHQALYAAYDSKANEVYVSDRLVGTIWVYNREGAFVREFKITPARPSWRPTAIFFMQNGNLLVTDLSGPTEKVLEIERSGKVVRIAGEDAGLNYVNGVIVQKSGALLLSDSNNGRLVSIRADGQSQVRIGRGAGQGSLGVPRGLAIDEQGRIFVADTTGQHIAVYREPSGDTKNLDFLGTFGDQGAGEGKFNFPTSIALDTRGRVYVTDTFNDRVQIWSY